MRVRVRFNRNVLGRRAGTVDWVEATPIVERLVINKYLTWLDEPKDPESTTAENLVDVRAIEEYEHNIDSLDPTTFVPDPKMTLRMFDEDPWTDDLGRSFDDGWPHNDES